MVESGMENSEEWALEGDSKLQLLRAALDEPERILR